MSYTLNDAMLAVVRYLLPKHSGVATGGSVSTLVDGTFVQANDQFNDGVLFFRSGTFANQFVNITDYLSPGGTFYFSSVGAPGIVAGVRYEAFATHSGMNVYDIISAINQALDTVGDVLQEDETLTTVDGQESYDLPAGVYNLHMVQIAQDTSTPYKWTPCLHWKELNDDLRIPNQYAYFGTSYPIRLTYLAKHDTLDTYDDAISQQINTEWLKYAASINLMQSMANRGANWRDMQTLYEKAEERVTRMRPKKGILVSVQAA